MENRRIKLDLKRKNGCKIYFRYKNSENLSKIYIESNFIRDGVLQITDFTDYFSVGLNFMYKTLRELGITFKKTKHSAQTSVVEYINNAVEDTRKIISPYELDIYIYIPKTIILLLNIMA